MYIPSNKCGVKTGYYSLHGLAELLRIHKNNPVAIDFISKHVKK